jgi:putative hemolysin
VYIYYIVKVKTLKYCFFWAGQVAMEIIIIFVLICINGIFALAEIAFVSARRERIEHIESQGNKNATLIIKMMETPDRFLSAIQVGITLVGILSGMFSGIALSNHFTPYLKLIPIISPYAYNLSLTLAVSIVTYLSIVLGELVPKSIALKNPERFIIALIPFISVFSTIMNPIISFLSFSTKLLLKLINTKESGINEGSDPIKEILGIAKMAAIKNKIDHEQEKIIENAISSQNLTVKDIMVSKNEMRVLTTEMSPADALVAAHVHHHTRYPLIDNSKNSQIIGYVNFKDIVNTLRLNPLSPTLTGIKRPIAYISENEKITDALRNLIRTHQHIALVRSRDGTVSGLITLENILETFVGDIKDEYDVPPDYLYDINSTRLLAGGGVTLSALRERIGPAIPECDKLLYQWLLEIGSKPLKIDTTITFNDVCFEIRKMSRSRISEIIVDFTNTSVAEKDRADSVQV